MCHGGGWATCRGQDGLCFPAAHDLERVVQKASATGMALDLAARRLGDTSRPQEEDSVCLQAMVPSHGLADVANDDIHLQGLWVCGIRARVDVYLPPLRQTLPGWLVATLDLVYDH